MCQCMCPALKGTRIAAHHTLAGMIVDTVRDADAGWTIHSELTVAGLLCIPVPEAAIHDRVEWWDELHIWHDLGFKIKTSLC